MCLYVRYTLKGELRHARCDQAGSLLPVKVGREVHFYRWGVLRAGAPLLDEERPGHIEADLPEGHWISLEDARNAKSTDWWRYKPKPVLVAVSAFAVYVEARGDGFSDLTWFELRPRQFLQGALCTRYGSTAVYIVTEPPPAGVVTVNPWPRIVTLRPARRIQA